MQQPPYQPGQPPYAPLPSTPPKKRSVFVIMGVMIAAALLICGLGNLVINGMNSQGSADTSSDPTPTSTGSHMSVVMTQHSPTAIIHPAATHAPVPTSKPQPAATAAILGAPLSAFLTKYGPPNDHTNIKSGLYHFLRYPGSNIDGLIIMVDTTSATKQINNINVNASDTGPGWTAQQASDACSIFFPPDAKYQRDVTLPNGNGIDAFYFSSSLANSLPASDFQDAQQNAIKLGSFDVQYLLKSNTEEKIVSCNILPGMSQTQ